MQHPTTRRRYLVPTWLLALIALAAFIALVLMPAPAHATEPPPPVDVVAPDTVEVAWAMPAGSGPCPVGDTGTTGCDATGWPQTHLPDPALAECGVWIQHDVYLATEAPGFYADGVLTQGEDYGTDTQRGAISWRFTYSGDCVEEPPVVVEPPVEVPPVVTPPQAPAPTLALTGPSDVPLQLGGGLGLLLTGLAAAFGPRVITSLRHRG